MESTVESAGTVPNVEKIAVLRANALGDYLFCLPALEALRAAYPSAEIVLLGAPWHGRFLAGRPGPVDRVLVVPPMPGVRDARPDDPAPDGRAAFIAEAGAERFDIALQIHGGGRNTNPLVAALGARVTAGLRADDAPPLDRWIRYVYYQPEVFRYLEVAALVGAGAVGYEPRLTLTAADVGEATSLVGPADRTRVALHPGATDPRRRWPPDRFAAVGDAAAAAGAEVIITGTPAEAHIVDAVRAAMRAPARTFVGTLSIGGLAAAYAGCTVVVSNDTGPLHVAAAVGTPAVGLFWVGNLINGAVVTRGRYRPIPSWTIHCPECGADCTRDLYPARTGGTACRHNPSFVADIAVSEVVAETLDLLGAGSATADPDAVGLPFAAGSSERP
jgi:ADP-heptose:LPS heptosyltransferase